MEVNADAGIVGWAISAAYYARYFAVYAPLSRIGIKCEIHDCSIALFADTVSKDMIEDLRLSKRDRIEFQYYPRESKTDTARLSKDAKNFVLKIKELLDSLDRQKISVLQEKLKRV